MGIGTNKKLVKSVAKLQKDDYSSNPELGGIYQRLVYGRKQFAEILEKNINAVMQISSLDLMMQHEVEEIYNVARKVEEAAEVIFGTSTGTAAAGGEGNSSHEMLTNTIIQVSEDTEEVYRKIEEGQDELTSIRDLSQQTMQVSLEMKKDMEELFEVINNMNEVIAGIDAISLQTKLLALNASIEAAHAGSMGKGFAVVADEIRGLAEETQKLTGSMGEFIEGIKSASQKSSKSTTNTMDALGTMKERIGNVWTLNEGNQKRVSQVSEAVTSLAAVSEEITSAMTEMENQLRNSTDFMQEIGGELKKTAEPVAEIEKTLDDVVKQMGKLSDDAFFHLENQEFCKYMRSAITAHNNWLANLERMVDEQVIIPLQLDSSKCGFGHFYYSITPDIPGVGNIWEELGPKHQKFHGYGSKVIQAMFDGETEKARQIYQEAKDYSRELISDMEEILHIAEIA
ncbi:methyl-accepting chemotaxis protein [Lachnospiraceae bacterium 29-84]